MVYCCAAAGIAVRRHKSRVRMGPVISQKAACLKGCERPLPHTRRTVPDQKIPVARAETLIKFSVAPQNRFFPSGITNTCSFRIRPGVIRLEDLRPKLGGFRER